MRVSQLLHAMDKEELIAIFDGEKNIGNNRIYEGEVRGIKKDNPINQYHINCVFAYDDVVIMEAISPKMKGGAE